MSWKLNIPMQFGRELAYACGLPALFVGKYEDNQIDYLWVSFGFYPLRNKSYKYGASIIFIKINDRLFGFLNKNGTGYYLFELQDNEDKYWNLIQQHDEFPDDADIFGNGDDGFISVIVTPTEFRKISIYDPKYCSEPTPQLQFILGEIAEELWSQHEKGSLINLDFIGLWRAEKLWFKKENLMN